MTIDINTKLVDIASRPRVERERWEAISGQRLVVHADGTVRLFGKMGPFAEPLLVQVGT